MWRLPKPEIKNMTASITLGNFKVQLIYKCFYHFDDFKINIEASESWERQIHVFQLENIWMHWVIDPFIASIHQFILQFFNKTHGIFLCKTSCKTQGK